MAADVGIYEWNGEAGSETKTDKTSGTVRFKKADDADVNVSDPIPKPAAGSVYSYEKYLRLRTKTAGPANNITNVGAYTDGANNFGTGITLEAIAVDGASYDDPVDSADAGDSNVFAYTSGSPLDLGAGPYTPGATTDFGDFIKLQMTVASTASAPQVLSAETLTFTWLET